MRLSDNLQAIFPKVHDVITMGFASDCIFALSIINQYFLPISMNPYCFETYNTKVDIFIPMLGDEQRVQTWWFRHGESLVLLCIDSVFIITTLPS